MVLRLLKVTFVIGLDCPDTLRMRNRNCARFRVTSKRQLPESQLRLGGLLQIGDFRFECFRDGFQEAAELIRLLRCTVRGVDLFARWYGEVEY